MKEENLLDTVMYIVPPEVKCKCQIELREVDRGCVRSLCVLRTRSKD